MAAGAVVKKDGSDVAIECDLAIFRRVLLRGTGRCQAMAALKREDPKEQRNYASRLRGSLHSRSEMKHPTPSAAGTSGGTPLPAASMASASSWVVAERR